MSEQEESANGIVALLSELGGATRKFEEEHGDLTRIPDKDNKYPMEVNAIKINDGHYSEKEDKNVGRTVRVRVAGLEVTHLGIYLGELTTPLHISISSKSKILFVSVPLNPAMWVPKLNRIVYGCESWWGFVESDEELAKAITDDDINDIWYVKALKKSESKEPVPPGKL